MTTPQEELSYDPRSWFATSGSDARQAPSDSHRRSPGRSQNWTLASGVLIATLGGVASWLARPSTPPAAQPVANTVRQSKPITEVRTLLVSDVADIDATLTTIGVRSVDAASAARMARAAMGHAAGELRLDIAMIPAIDGARLSRLSRLTVTQVDGSGVEIAADTAGRLASTPISAKLVRRLIFIRGELDGESFYSSAVAAGVNDMLVGEFANAFRYDFDMQREVSKGDVFEAGYEQRVTAEGDPVGVPTLVYAALSTAAKTRALYRYAPDSAAADWIDASGRSSRRALMRTPVEAARISSGFGMRGHPILGFVKMHRGTDFAAPTGTPIFAAGDATVSFAGPKGPNGNFVRLHHDNGWDTLYLHMNRIAAGLAPGMHVAQGQQIGEVGTTGRSTGPHLHYEVHIAGVAVDPLSIDTAGGRTLTGKALANFRHQRDRIDAGRAAASSG